MLREWNWSEHFAGPPENQRYFNFVADKPDLRKDIQLDANWCTPLNNARITEAEQAELKARYPELFQRCRDASAGFIHQFDRRSIFEISEEEREALFEKLSGEPGFGIWLANCYDT